ncbi:ABC transporter ATP-binding protein [Streptomyces sp. TLI_185]|uniref:ATP-binding cassette domain-containing protein n=1 Tax=Streptomyces sp. TLI_185 TaxID=2485151 RepID=UPI000FA8FB5B|nr:ABC transporter ATP-binding protein [Streptomyces sp. TLI_185]RPF31449.1 ABC transporter family protein [Streptomyces sp. TLI_185]
MNRAAHGLLRSTLRARRREFARLTGWSLVQAVPALLSGWLVARAVDDGFLAGRSTEGLGWLGLLACTVLLGAWGTRQATLQLADVVEPFRDDLVTLVTTGTLQRSARLAGPADTAGVARLTEQVEIARESYGAIVMFVQTFSVTAVSVLFGLVVLDPALLLFVLPPLAAGLALFLLALRAMAARQRAVVLADEAIAEQVGAVADGLRDVTACGAEDVVRARVGARIDAAAGAARALARLTAVRTAALGVGGWLPIVLILAGTPWLVHGGMTTGAILGALTYVSQSLQPALRGFVQGLGGSGLWLLVTLTRILEASAPTPTGPSPRPADTGPYNPPPALGTAGSHRATDRSPGTVTGGQQGSQSLEPGSKPAKAPPADPAGRRRAAGLFLRTVRGRSGGSQSLEKSAEPDNAPPTAPAPEKHKAAGLFPKTVTGRPRRPPSLEQGAQPTAPAGKRRAAALFPRAISGGSSRPQSHERRTEPGEAWSAAAAAARRRAAGLIPRTVTDGPSGPHPQERGSKPDDAPSAASGPGAFRPVGPRPQAAGPPGGVLPPDGSPEPDDRPATGSGAPAPSPVAPQPRDGSVELCGVTFGYARSAEPVVRDLDLVLAPGTHLAVVGPSGAGKSTLAALVAGVLEPRAGRIRLGGVPVRELDRGRLSRARVLIPQEAYVFTGTLRENLAYLQPAATEPELDAAVRAIGAQALVRRLGGYAATVDPAVLSAGERQLIALVRALLPPARLVLLDEATCHLDPAAEAVAERAFACRPATLIVCAHRISSALRADLVLVMDGSRCRLGTHDRLMADCALYRDLIGHWDGPTDAARPAAGGELAHPKGM